jgi:hypothetical protein
MLEVHLNESPVVTCGNVKEGRKREKKEEVNEE